MAHKMIFLCTEYRKLAYLQKIGYGHVPTELKDFAESLAEYAESCREIGYNGIGKQDIMDKLKEYLMKIEDVEVKVLGNKKCYYKARREELRNVIEKAIEDKKKFFKIVDDEDKYPSTDRLGYCVRMMICMIARKKQQKKRQKGFSTWLPELPFVIHKLKDEKAVIVELKGEWFNDD